MGSIKDIYDIIADLATRATSKQHKEEIERLNAHVTQLERDHAAEIARLKQEHAAEIARMNEKGSRTGSSGSQTRIRGRMEQ